MRFGIGVIIPIQQVFFSCAVQCMDDDDINCRSTAAWQLGRLFACDTYHDVILPLLGSIVDKLFGMLNNFSLPDVVSTLEALVRFGSAPAFWRLLFFSLHTLACASVRTGPAWRG
jgi:hypothetical protein